MKKKAAWLQILGVIFILLQLGSYTRLDLEALFAPNNTIYSDFVYILGQIFFFICYSFLGLLGIGLLLIYEKKNSSSSKKIVRNKSNSDYQKEKQTANVNSFVCSNCGHQIDSSATSCPHCGEIFEEEDNNKKKENKAKKTNSDLDQKYSDLTKLKELYDNKIITKEEFTEEKKKILDKE